VISRINAGCVWLSASSSSAIVRDLKPITGGGRYVFPSLRGADRPISANTVNFALRSMGYSGDDITGHGFRAMASTCLNEQGFPPDIIELQLAHSERNEVRAAYNRAKRMLERRDMMQSWADYLDKLRLDDGKKGSAENSRRKMELMHGTNSVLEIVSFGP
jgi:integrase